MTEQGDTGQALDRGGEDVMDMLHDHVPLTLLVDLVDAPPSEQVLIEEGLPEQQWWEHLPQQADPAG